MTSRSCCSEFFAVTRNRFARSAWLVALWSVATFLALPVAQALTLNSSGRYVYEYATDSVSRNLTATVNMLFGCSTSFLFIGCAIMGVVAAASLFAFLNSRTQCDFYFSQPVSRKSLFGSCYLTGFAVFAVPLLIATLLALLVTCVAGYGSYISLATVASGLGYNILVFLIFFNITSLWCVLCGSTVISLLCTGYSFTVLLALYYELTNYMDKFYGTYWPDAESTDFAAALSPFGPFVKVLDESAADFCGLSWWWLMAAWSVVGAGLALLALLLFTRRPSEKAGRPLAFDKVLPVVKYPLTVCAAVVGGIFFESMTNDIGWELFGYIFFGALTFLLVNVLEKFDFKNILHNLGKLGITAAALALVIVLMAMDVFGYDTRLPSRASVKSVETMYLDTYTSGYDNASTTVTDSEAIDLVYALCRECVEQQKHPAGQTDAELRITLNTDTGLFSRHYSFTVTDEAAKIINDINANLPLKMAGQAIWQFEPEQVRQLTFRSRYSSYLSGSWNEIYNYIYRDYDSYEANLGGRDDPETAKKLVAAMRADILQVTDGQRAASEYLGMLGVSGLANGRYRYYDIPVYSCYAKTLATGLLGNTSQPELTELPRIDIYVYTDSEGNPALPSDGCYNYENAYAKRLYTVKTVEQAAELLSSSTIGYRDLEYYGDCALEPGYALFVYDAGGNLYDVYGIIEGRLPGFVAEYISADAGNGDIIAEAA